MDANPTWSLIVDAARELGAGGAEFSRSAVIDAVMVRNPSLRANTIGAVIQSMIRNASNGVHGSDEAPIERISQGWYRLANHAPTLAEPTLDTAATGVILVGCVETKARHTCRARDLYLSPLFARRRRYAERRSNRWYIISAEHGLIGPDAIVEPYHTPLPAQTDEYRRAWGHWVVAKLCRLEGDLRGRAIEIHADDTYTEPLRQPLAAVRAVIRRPLAGLPEDDQIASYDEALRSAAASATEALPTAADLLTRHRPRRTSREQSVSW